MIGDDDNPIVLPTAIEPSADSLEEGSIGPALYSAASPIVPPMPFPPDEDFEEFIPYDPSMAPDITEQELAARERVTGLEQEARDVDAYISRQKIALASLDQLEHQKRLAIDQANQELSEVMHSLSDLTDQYEARRIKFVKSGLKMAKEHSVYLLQMDTQRRALLGQANTLQERLEEAEDAIDDAEERKAQAEIDALEAVERYNLLERELVHTYRNRKSPVGLVAVIAGAAGLTIGLLAHNLLEAEPTQYTPTTQVQTIPEPTYEPTAPELTPQPVQTIPHSRQTTRTKTRQPTQYTPTTQVQTIPEPTTEEVSLETITDTTLYVPTRTIPERDLIGVVDAELFQQLEDQPREEYDPPTYVIPVEDIVTISRPGPDGHINEGAKIQAQIPTIKSLAQAREYFTSEQQFLYYSSASLTAEDPYLAMAYSLKAGELCERGLSHLPFDEFSLSERKIKKLKSGLQHFENKPLHQGFYKEFRVEKPSTCL